MFNIRLTFKLAIAYLAYFPRASSFVPLSHHTTKSILNQSQNCRMSSTTASEVDAAKVIIIICTCSYHTTERSNHNLLILNITRLPPRLMLLSIQMLPPFSTRLYRKKSRLLLFMKTIYAWLSETSIQKVQYIS